MSEQSDTEVRAQVRAQRSELADILGGLSGQQWDSPSLCSGWRTREVIAHLTMPFRYRGGKVLVELAKSGGNFNRMSDRRARADAASLASADLAAALRDNVDHPWRPPGGGYGGALSHDVIHGLDITVPLGVEHPIPAERMRTVLAGMSQKTVRYFGADLDGIQLRAEDLDWSFGSGTPLTGAAQDLLLVVCGRRLPQGRLHGERSEAFTVLG
jgi:uncharacterized protein (TIGR03083 family)